jgi:predicted nuclease of restriction endonuclease-like (RecB) superfamily
MSKAESKTTSKRSPGKEQNQTMAKISVKEPLAGYEEFLRDLKARIRSAQIKAALSVNCELVLLYWRIGHDILERQEKQGWGAKVIDRLSSDLKREFPDMQGLSPRNLKYMRAFAQAWPEEPIVQEVLAQITWYHNLALLEKLDQPEKRLWYAHQTVANGWSRNVLVHQIDTDLYGRQVAVEKVTNFPATLPPPQSDLVQQTLKDPYIFDFLTLNQEAEERELERSLVEKIRDFLLELGTGFAFLGSQFHLEVGGQDFYIDLLFYHYRLRCLVVIDLKMGNFHPAYAGMMNFYLSALDDLVRHPDDQPSVGIILCRGKNQTIAEYALRDLSKPIGVSEYRLTTRLPEDLAKELPELRDLERLMEEENE